MHELAIAGGILDIALQEAPARKISAINLVIGELSSVVTEPVRFCFELIAAGTAAEGASLIVVRVPATLRCRHCSTEFGVDREGTCPSCGRQDSELVRGRECYVDSIEVED
ncbi:MAG: hydrogenase maturation nickel metallochaperone HypA [Candidatus Latescibacterota bacterium]